MLRIYATELSDPSQALVGWGIKVVMDGVREAGHSVEAVPLGEAGPRPLPDVWLLSLPWAGNVEHIIKFFEWAGLDPDRESRKGGPLLVLGGHAVVNVEPFCDLFDAIFVGEADDVIVQIGEALPDLDRLAQIPGIILGSDATSSVEFQVTSSLARRGIYRIETPREGVGSTSHLELARGCKAGCRFCELGWMYGYTERPEAEVEKILREGPPDLVLSAPDSDGVGYLHGMIADGRYRPRWRSTRVTPYLRHPEVAPDGRRGRIRFGIEGVTPRLRRLVGKPISDDEVTEALARAVREGYRMIRLFLIAGLPTESAADRRGGLSRIMDTLQSLLAGQAGAKLRHWKNVDIKITGLSPQPYTPFQRCGVGGAIEALHEYRAMRQMLEKKRPLWRQVMTDASSTEADVVKRMIRGEILPYIRQRGAGPLLASAQQRWRRVREICEAIDYDYSGRVLAEMPLDAVLPWHRTVPARGDRLARAERKAWEEIEAWRAIG